MTRKILGTAALSAALAIFLAVPADAKKPVRHKAPKPDVTYYTVPYILDETQLEGILVVPYPPHASMPVVVLFPDWMGVSDHAKDDAKRVAAMGYAVFIADPYGKESQPQDPQQAARFAGALRGDVMRMREVAAAGLAAAKRDHRVDSNRVALMGYCFGGNLALELARSGARVRGVASVHGNLRTPFPDDARNIRGPVLVLQGGADPHVPPAEVEAFKAEMRAVAVRLKFVEYPGAMHAFTNPGANDSAHGVKYDPQATQAAYGELKDFFAEVLAP
jgi:dienelactone hydrolase